MLRDITCNLPQQHDLLITHGPHEDNIRDTLQEEARYHQDTAVRSIHVHLQGAPRTQGSELRPHKHPRSLHRHSLSQENPGILHHRWDQSIVHKTSHRFRPIPVSFQAQRNSSPGLADVPQPHSSEATSSYQGFRGPANEHRSAPHGGTSG